MFLRSHGISPETLQYANQICVANDNLLPICWFSFTGVVDGDDHDEGANDAYGYDAYDAYDEIKRKQGQGAKITTFFIRFETEETDWSVHKSRTFFDF